VGLPPEQSLEHGSGGVFLTSEGYAPPKSPPPPPAPSQMRKQETAGSVATGTHVHRQGSGSDDGTVPADCHTAH
jgi:hypothetical protein